MTVSILGCGWYGLALAKALVFKGVTVKGSTTSANKMEVLKAAGIIPYLVDLAVDERGDPNDFFNADILIIAIPPKSRSGEGDEYVPKLKRAVNAIIEGEVKRVIFISSTGIYADLNKEVDDLTDPQPNTPSGKTLEQAEQLFKQQTDFKTTITRFGGLIGPARDPGRFFAGKKGIPNGLAPVNLIHLDDCIAITMAIIDKGAFGYTINACSTDHPPKADFYTKAALNSGLEKPEFIPELKEWKIVNSVHVPQLLGYQYQVSMK